MKWMLIMCIAGVALAADDPPPKTGSKPPAKAKSAKPEAPKPLTEIPAGAQEFEPGGYHYTDPAGKKWILRKTPFGIARIEDTGAPLPKRGDDEHTLDSTKVIDLGDSVRFERPGPFGTYKWEKKKTDLDEHERAAWEREKARTAKQDH